MKSLCTASTALPANPRKLRSGEWGAWVTGPTIVSGALILIRTRSGMNWFARITKVIWQGRNRYTGELGAICEVLRREEDGRVLQGHGLAKRKGKGGPKCKVLRTATRLNSTNGKARCPEASSYGNGFVSKSYGVLTKLEEVRSSGEATKHRGLLFTKCTQCLGPLSSPSESANGYCGNCKY